MPILSAIRLYLQTVFVVLRVSLQMQRLRSKLAQHRALLKQQQRCSERVSELADELRVTNDAVDEVQVTNSARLFSALLTISFV